MAMFAENEWAFDLLYCMAFMVMDKKWLERNATYMEFNVRNKFINSTKLDLNIALDFLNVKFQT